MPELRFGVRPGILRGVSWRSACMTCTRDPAWGKPISAQDTPHAERERIISQFKADPIPGEPFSQVGMELDASDREIRGRPARRSMRRRVDFHRGFTMSGDVSGSLKPMITIDDPCLFLSCICGSLAIRSSVTRMMVYRSQVLLLSVWVGAVGLGRPVLRPLAAISECT